jgi:ribose transport system ATP-binding protein
MSRPESEGRGAANKPLLVREAHGTLLEITGVSRSFGDTQALKSASLMVRSGEIHSLAGENGSGKSTLMKILSGVIRPGSGDITWDGQPVRFTRPRAAQDAGIVMVFQETLVVPELSIRDNVFLGTDGLFRHERHRRQEQAGAAAALTQLGLGHYDIETPLWQLSLAEQQLVTIARAIVRPWQLLILDESTSALDLDQRDRLFGYLREERGQGKSVLFTSHRMDEVEELADSVTVLRLGSTVARLDRAGISSAEMLRLMAGRATAERVDEVSHAQQARPLSGPEVLRVDAVALRKTSRPMSLAVRQGEILGLAGLEGQGQVEFANCVAAIARPLSGTVTVLGKDGAWRSPHGFTDANRRGIAFVPRDRRREGLFGALSIIDNFGFGIYPELNRLGVLRKAAIRQRFLEYAERMRLVYGSATAPVGTLSGGNQQKVLLGRWLATEPRILVLNDPMRGVDANTKQELYALLRSLADGGLALVLVSTDIPELLTLCDRVAVFHEGNLSALLPAAGTTHTDVMAAMFGQVGEAGDDD